MKACQNTGYFQRVYVRLLLCFISSVVFAGSANAFSLPNKIDRCYDCHGSPIIPGGTDIRPVDSAYRNTTSGGFVGNHQTHMSATIDPLTCTPCHGPAPTTLDHRNGLITMRQHINSTASIRGYYNKPVGSPAVFFNQTSAPVLSTCNNVNCHFRTTTPLWGSAPLTGGQTVANCQLCHQSTGMTSGNHTKHIALFGNTIATCSTCHPNQTTFTHATSAKAGRSVTVTFSAAPFGTGSYAAGTHASYPNYFGTTGYGTCNTVYCHSSAQSATGGTPPVYKAVTWNSAALACNGCHGNDAATLTSGSHSKHLNATYAFGCAACHGTAGGAGNTAIHANQTINIDLTNKGTSAIYTGDGTPQNSNFGTCNTTICHGRNSATWGTSVSNQLCTECHGQPNVAYGNFSAAQIAPGGTGVDTGGNTAANSPRVGAHQAHLLGTNNMSSPIHCGECHFTHTTIQDATHLNYTTATVTYQNAVLAKANSKSPSATRVSGIYKCNNTYCHTANRPVGPAAGQSGVNTPPVWNNDTLIGGTTIADSCTAKCHNMPPGAGVLTDTHQGLSAVTTFAGLAACSGCHSETLNASPSSFATIFKDKTKHIDGIVQAVGGNCDGCHDYDSVGAAYAGNKWTGGTWGKLNLGNYATANEGWGAHAKHINHIKTRLGMTVALTAAGQSFGSGVPAQVCGSCHTNTGTHNMSATAGQDPTGRLINFGDSTFKIGGATGTSFLYGASNPTYSPTTAGLSGTSSLTAPKTCSNISCHYFTTPLWSTY